MLADLDNETTADRLQVSGGNAGVALANHTR